MRRDWSAAEAKRGPCRLCGAAYTHLAHLVGRTYDRHRTKKLAYVHPAACIPLCPKHHGEYDRHEISILRVVTATELAWCVRRVGIGPTLRRLCGPEWPEIEDDLERVK